VAHSPRASPLGVAAPVGAPHVKARRRYPPRARRPRPRTCLRKGCNRQYLPKRWNQRYCHDPDCRREVRRWQAARRQAAHREDVSARSRHAQAERERRRRAKVAPEPVENVGLAPARGHAAENFFLFQSVIGRAAMKPPWRRPVIRRATVASPAVRPFAMCSIENASGSPAIRWTAARNGPLNTKRRAGSDHHAGASLSPAHGRAHVASESSWTRAGRQLSRCSPKSN
jgi:hypothetical protein